MKNPQVLRKQPQKKSKKKRIIALICIVAIVAGGAFGAWKVFGTKGTEDYTLTPYTVEKGDISVAVSGSGTVQPVEQYNIVSLVSGEILTDGVTVGSEVKTGDVLYTVDTAKAENNITQAENALEKKKLSYEQDLESARNLTVTVSADGVVTSLNVKNGDDISNGREIATVVNSKTLKLKAPFNASDAAHLSVGGKAEICLDSNGEILYGTVSQLYTGTYVSDSGAIVSDVEITFTNPGAVTDSDTATAMIGSYACNASGKISYASEYTITSKTSGEVTGLKVSEGDSVKKGQVLLTLSEPSMSVTLKTDELSVTDAELDLANAKDALDDYIITSPIDGKIIEKDYKAGDSLDSDKTTLAVVADMSKLIFTMDIDELDISEIKLNQEVQITADALPNQTFTGSISNIGIVGTSSNGVTTYPVEVTIEEYEGLLPGMNVSADIVAEEVTDVLKVPVDAVMRGDVVLVTEEYANSIQNGSSGSEAVSASPEESGSPEASASPSGETTPEASASASVNGDQAEETKRSSGRSVAAGSIVERPDTPAGYKYIKVTTGLNDEDYIEITAGLTEGAVVYVKTANSDSTTTEATSTATSSRNDMGGMSGGFSGGNSGGGMGGPPMG